MKTETRYFSNILWSWRKYLAANLSSYRRFYNPPSEPKPTDVNSWIVFQNGAYDPDLFTVSVPRVHCVARQDDRGNNLADILTDVLNVIDNKSTGKRTIDFYDKTSGNIIGEIRIESLTVSPEVTYDTGITSQLITVHTRVKTARRMK
jgi:hypothetical protein